MHDLYSVAIILAQLFARPSFPASGERWAGAEVANDWTSKVPHRVVSAWTAADVLAWGRDIAPRSEDEEVRAAQPPTPSVWREQVLRSTRSVWR